MTRHDEGDCVYPQGAHLRSFGHLGSYRRAGAAIALIFLCACSGSRPSTTVSPSLVDTITSERNASQTVTLSHGGSYAFADARPLSDPVLSSIGMLLLAGTDSRGAWYQLAFLGTPDCPYSFSANVWDAGGSLVLGPGILLPKAAGFSGLEPGASNVITSGPEPIVCLNVDGEVTRIR